MKKIFFLIGMCLLASFSASAQTAPKPAQAVAASKTYVKHIDTDGFLKNVWNYRKNREFKYEGKLPCIVDFYTVWCGPCKRIAPYMEELAKEYDGKIVIYKVNTEAPESRELAQVFNIHSIPTLFFFPANGAMPQATQGAMTKEQYKELIESILLQKAEKK